MGARPPPDKDRRAASRGPARHAEQDCAPGAGYGSSRRPPGRI